MNTKKVGEVVRKGKNKVGGLTLSDFKIYNYKATAL